MINNIIIVHNLQFPCDSSIPTSISFPEILYVVLDKTKTQRDYHDNAKLLKKIIMMLKKL